MARLIDADALNKELQKRIGSPTDDKLYKVNLCIIDATTIDAIPVEWLRQYAPEKWSMYMQAAVKIIIEAWQKEQEAKNG